jgi:hypothetical protein
MKQDAEGLFWLGTGPLAALVIGMALVPLRGSTTASNFTFVFLALTIAVGELGGRWPAVATALSSALSLDFFLTQPYLRLEIARKDDVIAFLGLAGCGLVAAALGSRRGESAVASRAAREHLGLLRAALSRLERGASIESRLAEVLEAAAVALPITAAAVRDNGNFVLAACGRDPGTMPLPGEVLDPDASLPALRPLPADGVRVALVVGGSPVGWLDVWGSGAPASPEILRTLADLGRVVAAMVANPRYPDRDE